MTLSKLMIVMVAIALNLACLRQLFSGNEFVAEAVISLVVMVNVLAFGAYRRLTRPGSRFNLGFLAFGALGALGSLWVVIAAPELMRPYLEWVLRPLAALYDRHVAPHASEGVQMLVLLPAFVLIAVYAALPQLLLAGVGGWLAHLWKKRRVLPDGIEP